MAESRQMVGRGLVEYGDTGTMGLMGGLTI